MARNASSVISASFYFMRLIFFIGRSLLWLGFASGLAACTSLKTISPAGLKHVRLGQEMPGPENPQLKAGPYVDTLLQAQGYQWPAKVIQYPEGTVWIEGDFFGADLVNRIRVESPEIKVKGQRGLTVGTAKPEFEAKHARWQVSYLPDYARYDVIDPQQPQIHFLFVAPPSIPEQPSLADLPDTATVQAIVVM
jgi:hypothetical protein